MKPLPAVLYTGPRVKEYDVMVTGLVQRVRSLMKDERYPPLHHQKVDLKVPFHIKHPRP